MPKRLFQLAFLAIFSLSLIGASSPEKRFNDTGHKLMCTCGCAEILLECNHVGCPNSTGEIADLHTQIDAGTSTDGIFQVFAAKYGPIVLAAPLRGGFDLVAWIVPFAVLVLGILGVFFLLYRWKLRHAALGPAIPIAHTPTADALRDRIRNETEY